MASDLLDSGTAPNFSLRVFIAHQLKQLKHQEASNHQEAGMFFESTELIDCGELDTLVRTMSQRGKLPNTALDESRSEVQQGQQ